MMMFIDFWTRLTQLNVMIGILVAVVGFGLILLSRQIVQVSKKTKNVPDDDHALMIIRGFGLIFILVAMFIMILR